MKQFYSFLEGLVWVVAVIGLLLALGSCAGSQPLTTTLSQPVDSALQRQVAEQRARALVQGLSTGKVKFHRPVTIQLGGAGNSANTTDAAKAKAPVAAAPNATASETKTSRGVPWQVYALGALVVFAAGFLLRDKLKIPFPF